MSRHDEALLVATKRTFIERHQVEPSAKLEELIAAIAGGRH
jgi:hypothetical protein